MSVNARLDIEKLANNPNALMVIAGLAGGKPLKAFIQSEITISGGNEYNSPFESERQSSLSTLFTKIQTAAGKWFDMGQFNLKSFAQTAMSWTSSQKPTFNMNMTFVALNPEDDVTKDVETIMSAVYPGEARGEVDIPIAGKFSAGIMKAPLGYGFGMDIRTGKLTKVRGTLAIGVGKWFRARQQIIRTANFTFSKEVIGSGKPLFASGSISFEPFRAITYWELKQYFRLHAGSPLEKSLGY